MGTGLSLKRGSIIPGRSATGTKRNSWTEQNQTEEIETHKKYRNHSLDDILSFRESKRMRPDVRNHFDLVRQGSSGSSSSCDVTEKDFVQKVQNYLRSIEQLGEISDIKCHFGNLTLRTEEETLNVEVVEEGEPIVTLESEPNPSNTLMIYQYSAKALNSRYTYFSMLYITDVGRSDSRYYVLQAGVSNSSGVPGFIPRRIKSSDNPKLISPSSRFVGTFEKDGPKSTLIVFLTKEMQPCYLAQTELSLDFTTDQFRAGIFDFKENKDNKEKKHY